MTAATRSFDPRLYGTSHGSLVLVMECAVELVRDVGVALTELQDPIQNFMQILLCRSVASAQLRQRMGLTNAGVTYLVRRMTAAGHIRRDTDAADRRRALLRYEPRDRLARSFVTHLGADNRMAMAGFQRPGARHCSRGMSILTEPMNHFHSQLDDTGASIGESGSGTG
jgi:hypothetical protein